MKIIFTITFLFFIHTGFSQKSPFSNEQVNKFALQAKDYIKDFTKTVKSLSNPPTQNCDKLCRQYKIDGTVNHFKKGATVQTINLKKKITTRSVLTYLNSVVESYSTSYKLVILTFDHIVINPNIVKEVKKSDGKTEYHMKGSFTQRFCVKNSADAKETNDEDIDSFTICEETIKYFDIIIEKKSSASVSERYVVLIGDISARSIKSLKDDEDN